MDTIAILFIKHRTIMKLYHFQTDKYSAHKTSDEYLTKFDELFDKFMEVGQGSYGKLCLGPFDLKMCKISDDTIIPILKKFIETCYSINNMCGNNSELLAIRDEIVANAKQLIYLLTFI